MLFFNLLSMLALCRETCIGKCLKRGLKPPALFTAHNKHLSNPVNTPSEANIVMLALKSEHMLHSLRNHL